MPKSDLVITIDSREPDWIKKWLPKEFPEITFKVEALRDGDFSSTKVKIERKSVSDLWSSLNDGRFHSQLDRLTTHQSEEIVIYLITGSVDEWLFKMKKMKLYANEDTINSAITSLLVRCNIRVICDSHEKLALKRMVKIIQKIELENILDLPSNRNPDTLMAKYLTISLTDFLAIKNKFGSSLKQLSELTETDLNSIKGITKVKSKKILSIINGYKC